MPLFRIHRMKDAPRQNFRSAPHTSGLANVKPRDYELAGDTEAENEYAAWAALRQTAAPLAVGDVLETENGALRICKYVGFDEARWWLPDQVRETGVVGQPVQEQPAGVVEGGL